MLLLLAFLAGGTNGQTMLVNTGAANTFTAHVTTTDTIDVKLIASSADVTSGILRVMACCIDTGPRGGRAPTEVDRDNSINNFRGRATCPFNLI